MKKLVFFILAGLLGLAIAACGAPNTNTPPLLTVTTSKGVLSAPNGSSAASASADYTGYCGQELADKKQLRDASASQINFTPQNTTIAQLDSIKQSDTPPRTGTEFNTYTMTVHLDKMKAEADSDIHVGISDGQGHTMIAEFIAPQCDAGLPHAAEIAQARANLFAECGVATNSFTTLTGQTATITGVAFFDKKHGQFDVASNGVELHPVLSFNGCTGQPAPPVTTPVTTTPVTQPTPTTPTPNPNDNGKGCKKYPGRHWYKHVYHSYCKSYFYTTE